MYIASHTLHTLAVNATLSRSTEFAIVSKAVEAFIIIEFRWIFTAATSKNVLDIR